MFGKKADSLRNDVAVGIDIGSFSVKVVQLSKRGDNYTVEAFGCARIIGSNPEAVNVALRSACTEAKLTQKKVNTAVSPDGVIVRFIFLPEMSSEDLKNAMEFEIERYVPFDKKDVISDYMVLKERPDSKNIKVLLVAAKKDFVESRINLIKSVGLDLEVVTIDALVLNNVFQVNYPEKSGKTIGLINIGAKTSNISIVRGATSYFMRDVQLGGESITHLLKEKLDLDINEAESTKCQMLQDDKEKFKIIEPVLGNLLNEIYLSFDYFESEFGVFIEEVYLAGGSANLSVLVKFLKENLNREVIVLNPLKKIAINPSVLNRSLEVQGSAITIALALAMENFN